jgi:cellulose/xylan binding protein with CBM9 domain
MRTTTIKRTVNMTKLHQILLLILTIVILQAPAKNSPGNAAQIKSYRSASDFTLTADPNAQSWKAIKGVTAERGPKGDLTPGHLTEIRSRWSEKNLYFLFICPYQELYLKSEPSTTSETNKLWDWDVAEVFIGTDFKNIKHYTEFQVSPQGEWVDLDIDRNPTPPVHDWQWNSGFEVKARVDGSKKIWYGEMRIPLAKIDNRSPQAGNEMRINFYRLQGPPSDRKHIAWSPTNVDNYHVPEAFGRLILEK